MKLKRTLTFLAVAALASMTGVAQIGPDVIVGDMPDIDNHARIGLTEAYSFGTTSCNIGDQPLDWIDNTPFHPVIGQNAFRLKSGRFEHIGQSWLKHGFTALQGTVCGSCTPNPNGRALGVGCSDPYSAFLNGFQSGLGPKYEVNAHTGVFPWPFSHGITGPTGNSVYKRLQILTPDLDPAQDGGGLYFIEGQYVTQDDAQAGNGDNNASWREVTFSQSGSNFTMSFAPGSFTHRTEPAIFAWREHDPAVVLRPVRIPGEGLFWVGFKREDLGGGLYGWEFAVHNLNSDRSARAFSVDFPAGAAVSGIGFHGPRNHSGGPHPQVPLWTSSIAGNTITWETATFATNPNAGALRWGTLYNFRFVTDQPHPPQVQAHIETFKGGATIVPITFDPPNVVGIGSGNDQVTNANEPFASPVEALVTVQGQPAAGVDVTFSVTGGTATLGATGPVTTDANGLASTTVTAGPSAGAIEITASTDTSSTTFDLFSRRFTASFFPQTGLLIFNFTTEVPNLLLTVASDVPQRPRSTPFGDICTSVGDLPGPDLTVASALPGMGLHDPTLVTGATGVWSRVVLNAGALAGLGARDVQVYAYFLDTSGVGQFMISNCSRLNL